MAASYQGGCECGDLRYRIEGEPLVVIACHCKQCQRQSGAAFSMTMVVPRDILHVEGETKVYSIRGDSGGAKDCHFCPRCGIRIYNALEKMPATVNIKPGTLDDTSWLEPRMVLWTDSKQPWVPLPDGVRAFAGNPS